MSIWSRRTGITLAIVGGAVFLAYAVSSIQLADLLPHLTWKTLLALVAAAFLYSLTVPISAWAWRHLLAAMGTRRRLVEMNVILLTTQIGKYVPGNVGHHIGRVGLALSHGIPSRVLFASIAYETFFLLLAGVLTGLVAALVSSNGIAVLGHHRGVLEIAVVIAVMGLLMVPVLGRLLPRLLSALLPKLSLTELDLRLGIKPCLLAFAGYTSAYLAIGSGIGVLSTTLFPSDLQDYALLTAAFAIAWVVGFVTPGAPAGIGIREGVLALILGAPLGPGNASILVLALRVATTLGDILCFLAGLLLARMDRANR